MAPGLILALVISAAARFGSEHTGGPATVYALAFGMSLGVLASQTQCQPGLIFASRHLVRWGIILLGLTFGLNDILDLGLWPLVGTVACLLFALFGGWALARVAGFKSDIAVLTACASAICGATAAMAVATILPQRQELDRARALVVAIIALISTVAMIALPALLPALGFQERESGFVIGAMIADVAQVVGAGFALGDDAGQTATLVKLVRVSCLAPVVVVIGLLLRHDAGAASARPPLIPGFIVAFAAMIAITSTGVVPPPIQIAAEEASRWCLLAAIAAIGVQTSLSGVVAAGGWRLPAVLGGQAILLLAFACGMAAILL